MTYLVKNDRMLLRFEVIDTHITWEQWLR